MANGASRHILVTMPGSGRIVFVPLVNVQKDGLHLLHGIKRTVCNTYLGCPYIIHWIRNVVADTDCHTPLRLQSAKSCNLQSLLSPKPVKIKERCSRCITFTIGSSLLGSSRHGRMFHGTLRELSFQLCFHFSSGSLPRAHCGAGGVCCVLKKKTPKNEIQTKQKKTKTFFSEVSTILRTWSSLSVCILRIGSPFQKLLGLHIKPTASLIPTQPPVRTDITEPCALGQQAPGMKLH